MGLLQLFKKLLSRFSKSESSKPKAYEVEIIGNNDLLFRRVHYNNVDRSTYLPSTNAFKDLELSCDWSQYSTPQKTRELIGKEIHIKRNELKDPNEFFICSLSVADIKLCLMNNEIRHDPIFNIIEEFGKPNNRAHSLVVSTDEQDKQRVKSRYILSEISKWDIFSVADYKKLI